MDDTVSSNAPTYLQERHDLPAELSLDSALSAAGDLANHVVR